MEDKKNNGSHIVLNNSTKPVLSEIDKKLFAGEWIFNEKGNLSYKLDKQGTLIFNSTGNVTREERLEFTIEALVQLGTDEKKAEEIASHMGPMQ